MLLFLTIPTSPITSPANSGKASNLNFPALGRAFPLPLRPDFDQNKRNRPIAREQKRSELRAISDLLDFDGLVCGNEEAFRGQVRLKSFLILYSFESINS